MANAKLEPGDGSISLGKAKPKQQNEKEEEKDLLPELGLKRPTKPKSGTNKPTPADPGIDLSN